MLNGGGVSGSELNGVPVILKKSKLRKRLCAFPESLFSNGFATFAKKRRLKSCDHAQQPAAPPSLSRDGRGITPKQQNRLEQYYSGYLRLVQVGVF